MINFFPVLINTGQINKNLTNMTQFTFDCGINKASYGMITFILTNYDFFQ